MPLEGSDELLVNRSGTTHTLEQQNLMAEIQGEDLLLVNRSDTTYKVTGQELIDSVVPDLELIITFIPNVPYIDEVITAVPNTSGGVEPEGGYTFTYQWSISDDINGTNQVNLLGANSNTYTPTADQQGKFLGCTVQTTDARGTIANATGRTGPIDFKPATDPPVINSVVLTQDAVNDKRFSDNSFTTTVDATNRPNQLTMEAQVVGALSLAVGTDVITSEDTDGKAPLDLTLASDVNLGEGRFEVGDEVTTNESYTPTTSSVVAFYNSEISSSFATGGTINISNLAPGETFVIISIEDGYGGSGGGRGGGEVEGGRGGCAGKGGDAGSCYYRKFTREEFIAEFGNTYTQSKSNNFNGITIYDGGVPTPSIPTTSRCNYGRAGSYGETFPAEPGTIEALNEALDGIVVFAPGSGGAPGPYSGETSGSWQAYYGQTGDGGDGGLTATSDFINVPTIPSGGDGTASTDSRGGTGGKGGVGWGAGGGGGGADGDNGSSNNMGSGAAGASGINIVVIGTGLTTVTLADDKDINKFQPGDYVQGATDYIFFTDSEARNAFKIGWGYYRSSTMTSFEDLTDDQVINIYNPEKCFSQKQNVSDQSKKMEMFFVDPVTKLPADVNPGVEIVLRTPYLAGGNYGQVYVKYADGSQDTYDYLSDAGQGYMPAMFPEYTGKFGDPSTKSWVVKNDTKAIRSIVFAAAGSALTPRICGIMVDNKVYCLASEYDNLNDKFQASTPVSVLDTDVSAKAIIVDGGTWDTSNQSKVWSNGAINTDDPENVFDGNLNTVGGNQNNGGTSTITFTPPLNVDSTIRFYGDSSSVIYSINGADQSPVGDDWQSFDFIGNLTTVAWRHGAGARATVAAIEIDGRVLVDAVNDNQVWSQMANNKPALAPNSNVFDGNINTCNLLAASDADSNIIFTLTPVPVGASVEIKTQQDVNAGPIDCNGVSIDSYTNEEVITQCGTTASNTLTIYQNIKAGQTTQDQNKLFYVKVDGKLLVDPGARGFGDTQVSTLSPKQGEGTISAINSNVVSIDPFVDNCFVDGQYLIHTTPKPIKITPKTEVITDVDFVNDVLTFAGNDELIEFATGDSVSMCDANGIPATALIESSVIDSVAYEFEYITSGSNANGTQFDFSEYPDNAELTFAWIERGENGDPSEKNDQTAATSGGDGGDSGDLVFRQMTVGEYRDNYSTNIYTYSTSTNGFGGSVLLTGGVGSNAANGGYPIYGGEPTPESALDTLNAAFSGVIWSFGDPGINGSQSVSGSGRGGGGGAGYLISGVTELVATPTGGTGSGEIQGGGGTGGTGWGCGGGGGGGTGWSSGGTQYSGGGGGSGCVVVMVTVPKPVIKFTTNSNLQYFKAGDVLLDGPATGTNTQIYAGSNSIQSIKTPFSPDFVWIKNRSLSASHHLYDRLRGVARLNSDEANPQNNVGDFQSWDDDGFTLNVGAQVNTSGSNFAAWSWDAGSAAPVTSNFNGVTLPTYYKANVSKGFSVCTYDGGGGNNSYGHGLGTPPNFVLVKRTGGAATDWATYHSSVVGMKSGALSLNTTGQFEAGTESQWNANADFSNIACYLANNAPQTNQSGASYVAYNWVETPGVSKFGSYTGQSGNPFSIECGFKPALVIIKRYNSGAGGNWVMISPSGQYVYANLTNGIADASSQEVVFTETGFTVKGSNSDINSGGQHLYCAWSSTGVVATVLEDADVVNKSMLVDGGNWDGSNQSQVWSDDVGPTLAAEPAPRMFDGDLTTSAKSADIAGTAGEKIVWTPSGGFSYTSKVEVYTAYGSDGQPRDFFFQLNTETPFVALTEGWHTLATGSGTIDSISSYWSADYRGEMWAIRVDGRLLVDPFDDSQVWSDDSAFGAGTTTVNGQLTEAFDGNMGSWPAALGGTTWEWTPSDGLTYTDKVEVRFTSGYDSYRYRLNDEALFTFGPGNEWVTIDTASSGTITKLETLPPDGSASTTSVGPTAIRVDGKLLLDTGVRYLGETTAKVSKSGTGVVDSVNLENNTMTLSSTNGEWVPGYYVSTPEKNAVEMRGYLSFDSQGNNVDLQRLPQSPVLMDDIKTPKLNFSSTFSTGEGVDTDLPFPTYLETYVQASNDLGSSLRVKSNELFPNWTGRPYIAPGSYRVMQEEFGQFCYWACSSDYRSAIKTIQDAEQTVQQLRAKAETMASDFLARDDVY